MHRNIFFIFCLYVNVYKYVGLSISGYVYICISHTYNLHVVGSCVFEEVLKHMHRVNLAGEYQPQPCFRIDSSDVSNSEGLF